jgi:hypothetical protein
MKRLLISCLFLALFCSMNAQIPTNLTNGVWQNALVRADGKTSLNGVEAYCTKSTCGTDDYVLVKFVNTNAYQVAVEWIDGIYVDGNWIYSQNPTPKKIYVPASTNAEGVCNGGEIKLKVMISSLTNSSDPNKHFSVTGLTVTQ